MGKKGIPLSEEIKNKISQTQSKNIKQRKVKRSNYTVVKNISINMTVLKSSTSEWFSSLELFDNIGEIKILGYILQQVRFEKDQIYHHSATRQKVIESKYGYSRATQNNYIRNLVVKNFLQKRTKGEYVVNPEMIGLK